MNIPNAVKFHTARKSFIRAALAVTCLWFLSFYSAQANTADNVTGTAANTALDTTTNWSTSALPTTTSDAVFTSGTAYVGSFTLNTTALSLGTLNDLNATALTITGNKSITFNGGTNAVSGANASDLIYVASGGSLTINDTTAAGITLAAGGNFDNAGTLNLGTTNIVTGASGPTLTFSGAGTTTVGGTVSGSYAVAVNASGGTVVFSGNNTYTGGLTLTVGTLRVTPSVGNTGTGALSTGNLTLGGGVLQMANVSGTNMNALANNGVAIGNLNFGRPTTLTGGATVSSDVLSGSGGWGNTYTLGTLTAGSQTLTVTAGSNVAYGTAGVTFGAVTSTGATFTVNNPGNGVTTLLTLASVSDASGTAPTFNGSGNTTVTGNTTTTSGLTYSGTGLLTLSGVNQIGGSGAPLTITSGTVQIGNGALSTATLNTSNSAVTDNSSLIFNVLTTAVTQGGASTFGAINGTGSLTQAGTDTLTLNLTNGYTGATTVTGRGTLNLNFGGASAPLTNIISSSSSLSLGAGGIGGTLTLTGTASKTNSQAFNGTTISAGASTINLTNNATSNPLLLNLGAITRNVGGTVNFNQVANGTIGSTNGYVTSTGNNAAGILGGWATVGGTTWATNNGTNIVGLNSYTQTSAALNVPGNYTNAVDVNSSQTPTGAITPDSLRFNTAAPETLTLTGSNTIGSGGILVTSAVANNASVITGGTLKGASGADLVVIQNNTLNTMTIGSVIADNGGATGLTLSGSGSLILAGVANTYTGPTVITGGTLQIGAGSSDTVSALSPTGAITNNGSLVFVRSNTATQGTDFGTIGGTGSVTQSGTGTLVLNAANTFTGQLTVNAGGTVKGTTNAQAFGASTVSLSSANLYLTNASGTNLAFGNKLTATGTSTITSDVTSAGAGNTYTLGALTPLSGTITIAGGGNVTSGTAGVAFGAVTQTGNVTYNIVNPTSGGTTVLTTGVNGGTTAAGTYNTTIIGNGNYVVGVVTATGNAQGGLTSTGTLTLGQAGGTVAAGTAFSGTMQANYTVGNLAALVVNSGTYLGMSQLSGLGNGPIYLGDTSGTNSATLISQNVGQTLSATSITVNAGTTGKLTIAGMNGGGGTLFPTINMNNNLTLDVIGISSVSFGAINEGTGALTLTRGTGTGGSVNIKGNVAVGTGGLTLVNTSTYATTSLNLNATSTVSGTGNLTLQNNTGAAGGITLAGTSVNNVGTINNSGVGTGSVVISAPIGSNVTGVTQNSVSSMLTLSGANTYTGATTVSAGTLAVSGAGTLASTNLTVANGATFSYQPTTIGTNLTLGTASTLSLNDGSNLSLAWNTTTANKITALGAATVGTGAGVGLNMGTGFTSGTTYTILAAGSGLGTGSYHVLNNTNYTAAISKTATAVTITPTTATAIAAAYWKGSATTGLTQVWAASNGISGSPDSNWATTPTGAVQALVPGSTADVTIQNAGTAATSTTLGASMTIKSLTLADTTNAMNLNADGNTLTIASAAGITMNTGVQNSTFAAPIALGAAQTWTNNSTAGTLTVNGAVSGAYALTVAGAGNTTIGGAIATTGAGTLTKTGTGTLTLSGANTYTGNTSVTIGTLLVNGSLASSSVSVSSGATLGGSGKLANATLSGAGQVGPGNSPGILTASQVNPTGGLGFNFEYTNTGAPAWNTPTGSGNDVMRLTNATTPFTASLTSANAVNFYLDVSSLTASTSYQGGFFTDQNSNFLTSVQNATQNYFVLGNGSGSHVYNGVNYYTLAEYNTNVSGSFTVTLGTFQVASANFSDGNITNGWVTDLTVVPEPATWALLAFSLTTVVVLRRRRNS